MALGGAILAGGVSPFGPLRHSRPVGDLVAYGEQQTLIRISAERLGCD